MNSTVDFSEDKLIEISKRLHFYKLFYCEDNKEYIEELSEIIETLET